jgi:hypothetical protein
MADLCLDFKNPPYFFFRVVAPACIPTSSVLGFFFPTSLQTTGGGGVFDDGYSNWGEVES